MSTLNFGKYLSMPALNFDKHLCHLSLPALNFGKYLSLICQGLGIPSFPHRSFAHLLICSDCSDQMSDSEQFAQIVQDK